MTKAARPLATFRFSVCGRSWLASLLDAASFEHRFGGDSVGITEPDSRCVFIHEDACDEGTIRHEMTHAWFASMCINRADLTGEQMEEVACEVVAEHGPSILAAAKAAHRRFKRRAPKRSR